MAELNFFNLEIGLTNRAIIASKRKRAGEIRTIDVKKFVVICFIVYLIRGQSKRE